MPEETIGEILSKKGPSRGWEVEMWMGLTVIRMQFSNEEHATDFALTAKRGLAVTTVVLLHDGEFKGARDGYGC